MAFGVKRAELEAWKEQVRRGEVAFITHFWLHPRCPDITTVTKAGCADLAALLAWGEKYGLGSQHLHHREEFPHFDLIGDKQKEVLVGEALWDQIKRFRIKI
ncbi:MULTISPECIES: hypothetical protein [Aneurinibacillus]|uniref:Uncharacterized protein n=1 Tax=Aneurinibacillus thermoaerophilus TaxID=143495 RepID=A0A1G7XYV0_ANETH|nr:MULTISPECIES: hypothetical protein [Aneurinibacillus]AMA73002.1 hypothetical protein ACH33_09115 [Aneurinibacillus sp. XH2]MED0675952.1 hypothetical protein [Aneurinibacillus thermoaerophilus]MED0677773.1 hypothetical protein [Aneurinibacillus thermoaerophilus]MED0737522.1 hypothetical protein [Aneurinibacillus thermoaerophilus]MED0758093.1 hypothetical protein [Aneurinibacillus thermoaerophilus]